MPGLMLTNETEAANRHWLHADVIPMNYNYLALIQGGIGPDVWDKEMQISGVDFRDAANQATARAEELGGQVVELNQNDWNTPIEGSLTALKRTLQRLDERVHSSYDFNSDPDQMTLEVGNALNGYNIVLGQSGAKEKNANAMDKTT